MEQFTTSSGNKVILHQQESSITSPAISQILSHTAISQIPPHLVGNKVAVDKITALHTHSGMGNILIDTGTGKMLIGVDSVEELVDVNCKCCMLQMKAYRPVQVNVGLFKVTCYLCETCTDDLIEKIKTELGLAQTEQEPKYTTIHV